MVGPCALLSAVLSLLPPPSAGVRTQEVVGHSAGKPVVLEVIELETAGSHSRTGMVRAEVRTAMAFLAMAKAARQDGVDLQVSSGFRTREEQAALFRLYRLGRGPLASRPGASNHESGHALDLETRQPKVRLWLRRHAGGFGFHRTVPSERWHWEYW